MSVIVFDVNETLLDLAGLDGPFAEVFGDRGPEVRRLWFARLLHASTVMALTGTYQDLGVLGRTVLADTADRLALPVTAEAAAGVVGAMRELAPHEDAAAGIEALRAAGHRVAALTNSGQATAEAQLAFAGLDGLLEEILSVEATRRFKPDLAVYDHAAEVLGADTADMVLVACHDWDCAGAMKAGWRSGYVARPGTTYLPLYQPPTWQETDLLALAEMIGAGRG